MSEFLNCSFEWDCTTFTVLEQRIFTLLYVEYSFAEYKSCQMYLQLNSCECTSVISRLFFVCALSMFVVFVKLNKCQHCKSLSACVDHWSALSAAARPYRANEILTARQIDAIP